MADTTKSYRIRTDIGSKLTDDYITVDANLVQDYDAFDILSVSIDSIDTYKLHNSNYGVVVGRVLANNGFGIPNAKISIFISSDGEDGEKVRKLYPYTSSAGKDSDGVRYNLFPDEKVSDCHQVVGTFPNKRYALDNDVILEVFDKYYKYTARTNNAGDYLIMGVPTGAQTIHMDLDLSDCGILSQRPRDFVYKGYTIEQFENANMFKEGTNYPSLSQVFSQDRVVNVRPFWGNSSLGEELGITRADIDVAFTFEPTCVFIGSVISDNSSQGITKKCMGTEMMGNMEELVTGEGTIEMIRMTPAGNVEEFQVKGTQLIDGDGVWCYQIPMNLDYMMTDEYGNMVPTDDPSKGVATRTRVRFRISMQDNEENVDNFFRPKVLVPHNPQNTEDGGHEDYDYEFGTYTREDSFRDLFWNNVYSVKSYIPRFQKRKVKGWKDKRFVGIKNCNFYGANNPIPYNNIRIRLPFMFTVMCAIIKTFIFIVGIINTLTSLLGNVLADLGNTSFEWLYWVIVGLTFGLGKLINIEGFKAPLKELYRHATSLKLSVLKEGLCPDLENWYFAPMWRANLWIPSDQPTPPGLPTYNLLQQTLDSIKDTDAPNGSYIDDSTSIDYINRQEGDDAICLTTKTDYLISCIEMNLAMEYRVINFDFYNDWLNGTIYIPRFMRYIRPKKKFLGITVAKTKIKGCMDDPSVFSKTRRYTQQCALNFRPQVVGRYSIYSGIKSPLGGGKKVKRNNNFHKKEGFSQKTIFGSNGGITHEKTTMLGDSVYYMKPCEWTNNTSPSNMKVNLFATDIILLGTLNDCDQNGLPQAFRYLSSTSYVLPTNLALTNMEENGPLYATPGSGTICASGSTYVPSDGNQGESIKVVSQNEGISGELVYFSGTQASEIDLTYDPLELSDYIALTEAAGISWNFTGPNQGNPDDNTMFTPGGHFLGLSCVNSQTNIKSCINLSRICEIGVNMSQRKEDVSLVTENEGVSELHYTYTAPSGFISGDDIVGESFRSMFATMNQNRLLATRTNPDTGYKVYDFTFLKPINFNGAFSQVATMNAPYNQEIPISISEEQKAALRSVGIAIPGEDVNASDYDAAELGNTQIRTIEDASVDYYAFRMGLDYSQMRRGNQYQIRKLLLTKDSNYYLPQYENSYYFYFGLHGGSTAIEKFNTQFFAKCANSVLTQAEPNIILNVEDIDVCNGTGSVNVVLNNLTTPYQLISYYREGDNFLVAITNGSDDEDLLNSYSFVRSGLTLGNYTFRVIDANDVEIEESVNLSDELVTYDLIVHDFNGTTNSNIILNEKNLEFRGGYLEIQNLKIPLLPSGTRLHLVTDSGKESSGFTNDGNSTILLEVDSANVIDNLYVTYDCGKGGGEQKIFLQTFKVLDTSAIKLYMGIKDVFELSLLSSTHSINDWWTKPDWKVSADYEWWTKYCLVNEINEPGSSPFSLNVLCENGTKVVWGTPQNSEGFYTDMGTYSTEEYEKIPEGYSLDDDYSYYSTVVYEKNNNPKHYSILAYNGQMVYGDYCGIWTWNNENENPHVEPIGLGNQFLNNGYGYIFKPLPEGDLEFMIYDGNWAQPHYDYEGNPYSKGLIYPSFIIPVFSRPFYANAEFFVWENLGYNETPDGTNRFKQREERCGHTEMTVYNGVTWDLQLGQGRSYITNIEDNAVLKAMADDFAGISTKSPRTITFSGTTESNTLPYGTTGITAAEYEIYWGTPENESWAGYPYAKSISEYKPFNFASSLSGIVYNDEISFNTEESKDITYYICKQELPSGLNNSTDLMIEMDFGSPGDLFEIRKYFKGKYYIAHYAAAEWHNQQSNWHEEWNTLKVYVTDDNGQLLTVDQQLQRCFNSRNNQNRFARWAKVWQVSDGTSGRVLWEDRDRLEERDEEDNWEYYFDWDNQMMILKEWINKHAPDYKIEMYPRHINMNVEGRWYEDVISKNIINSYAYDEEALYYGVGIDSAKTLTSTYSSVTTTYKIYPYFELVDSKEIISEIVISPMSLKFKASYDEDDVNAVKEVSVIASLSDDVTITVDDGADWINVQPAKGSGKFGVDVSVLENTEPEERTGTVTFTSSKATNKVTLTITQEGNPQGITVSVGDTNFDYTGGIKTSIFIASTNNTEWQIESDSDWATPSPTNGNGMITPVTITVSENTDENARSATLTISSNQDTSQVTIYQDGKPKEEEGNENIS